MSGYNLHLPEWSRDADDWHRSRAALVPILAKWSTKIQAASLAVGGKAAGSSKFLAGIKGQTGVFEAIEAGMTAKVCV